jgi:hypothetical protein
MAVALIVFTGSLSLHLFTNIGINVDSLSNGGIVALLVVARRLSGHLLANNRINFDKRWINLTSSIYINWVNFHKIQLRPTLLQQELFPQYFTDYFSSLKE